MSKILKRPMFRGGGAVNSKGTGIMSGLEPRVEMQEGGFLSKIYNALNPSTYEILKRAQEQQQKPYMFEGLFEPTPIEEMTFPSEEVKQQALEEEKQKQIEQEKKKLKTDSNEILDNLKQTEKTEFQKKFEEFLPVFQEQLGADADEARRQKYMQLAKFGLGLLAQPGGSLAEAVGKAGAEPLAGLEAAAAREAEAKKLPKALALEAALKQIEPKTATELGIVASRQSDYAENALESGLVPATSPGAAGVYAKQIDVLVQDPKTRSIAGKFKKSLPDPTEKPEEYKKKLPKSGKGYFVNYDGTLTVYDADTKTFYDINDIEFYQE